MMDQTLCKALPNGCQVRIQWSATDRRYRAELTLPAPAGGLPEVERSSAPAPDGIAKLLTWATQRAENAEPSPEGAQPATRVRL